MGAADSQRRPQPVAEYIDSLRSRFDVQTVILFGSRARGDGDESSDWDLFIVGRNLPANWHERMRAVWQGKPVGVDVFAWTKREVQQFIYRTFIQDIAIEGVSLYGGMAWMRDLVQQYRMRQYGSNQKLQTQSRISPQLLAELRSLIRQKRANRRVDNEIHALATRIALEWVTAEIKATGGQTTETPRVNETNSQGPDLWVSYVDGTGAERNYHAEVMGNFQFGGMGNVLTKLNDNLAKLRDGRATDPLLVVLFRKLVNDVVKQIHGSHKVRVLSIEEMTAQSLD